MAPRGRTHRGRGGLIFPSRDVSSTDQRVTPGSGTRGLLPLRCERPEDEHRLLDQLLRCFLKHEALPDELVVGPLAETGLVVPMTVGLPPPEDRAFADVWSALGGELKPSLDIVVIAPIATGIVYEAALPASKGTHVDMSDLVGGGTDTGRHQHVPPPASVRGPGRSHPR